jgi:hypothetical protein
MKMVHQRSHLFVIIAISLSVLAYPVYLQYNNLAEIDFFSPNPTFEILDQEDLLAYEENKAKIFTLSFSCGFPTFNYFSIGPFSPLSFQTFSFDQLIPILRC